MKQSNAVHVLSFKYGGIAYKCDVAGLGTLRGATFIKTLELKIFMELGFTFQRYHFLKDIKNDSQWATYFFQMV